MQVLGQCFYSYLWADLVSNSVFHGEKPSKHLQTTQPESFVFGHRMLKFCYVWTRCSMQKMWDLHFWCEIVAFGVPWGWCEISSMMWVTARARSISCVTGVGLAIGAFSKLLALQKPQAKAPVERRLYRDSYDRVKNTGYLKKKIDWNLWFLELFCLTPWPLCLFF